MRVSGVNLPKDKSLFIALTYVFGIGRPSAMKICAKAGVSYNKKVHSLAELEEKALLDVISADYIIEGDLRKKVAIDIKHLIDIGCYRGIRHRRKLPVRGQRSRTNARTRKARARVPVAGKKKAI